MKKFSAIVLKSALFLYVTMFSFTVYAQDKYALIIGNSDYSATSTQLKSLSTPVNDANAMVIALEALGYKTTKLENTTRQEMLDAVNKFVKQIKKTDVAIFYYSGHAVTIDNEQYLVPCKEKLNPDVLNEYSVAVRSISSQMSSKHQLSLLFLDACRNVTGRSEDSDDKGVTEVSIPSGIDVDNSSEKPHGQKIFYATQDGKKAYTGSGSLSYFTKYLVKHLFDGEEFRVVWDAVSRDVRANCIQTPVYDGTYDNPFYFNHSSAIKMPASLAHYFSDETIAPPNPDEENITKTFILQPNFAKLFIGDKSYNSGVVLTAKKGTSYKFRAEADGYLPTVRDIEFSADSPSEVVIGLQKVEKAKLRVYCENTAASVYLDDKYVGRTPAIIETTTGYHDIRLTRKNYYSQTAKINIDTKDAHYSTSLSRNYPDWFEYDDDGANILSYHFSPKYEIGLSYLYRFEDSRWSLGTILGASAGLFRGWDIGTIRQTVSIGGSTSTTVTINGVSYEQASLRISTQEYDSYSEEVDPYNEAKKYDANFLFLGNCGFNVCNGFMLEAGIGAGYHKDKYKMPHTYDIVKTTTTNLTTGELLEGPKYQYQKVGGSKWYGGKSKWSPAFRLGTKFLIPIDGFWSHSSAITLGGGYTYLPCNNKFSSWDVNVGYTWFF